jgi:hypothetical protein
MAMLCISDELFESMNSDTPMELYYNYYNDEENFPYIRAEDEPRNKAVTTGFTTEEKTENMTILRGMGYEVAAATVTHSFYAAAVDPDTPIGSTDYLVTFAKENGTWLIVETVEITQGGAQK